MKITSLFIAFLFVCMFFLWTAPQARASEGKVELRSNTGQNDRCLVTSTFMKELNYTLLVNCRDLTYPPAPDKLAYVLWSIPVSGNKPEKIGELGLGKAEFKTKNAFSTLFVTKEVSLNVQNPSEPVVLQGRVETIDFLGAPTSPTPTPIITSPTPSSIATGGGQLISTIRRIATIFLISLFVIIIFAAAIIITLRRSRS
ncbi:anti-sigma factor [Candidatus Microgenomates bacterium]|nr:anti-sigma factor [Candidatus Microgenomates bacterium]